MLKPIYKQMYAISSCQLFRSLWKAAQLRWRQAERMRGRPCDSNGGKLWGGLAGDSSKSGLTVANSVGIQDPGFMDAGAAYMFAVHRGQTCGFRIRSQAVLKPFAGISDSNR